MSKCSTTGPSASAGKNVRAPTIRTTPTRRTTKTLEVVLNVPEVAGTAFLAASEPAIASGGDHHGNRPKSIEDAHPEVVERFSPSPANAEPLLPGPDENA